MKKRPPKKHWHETATAGQYAKLIKLFKPFGRELHTHQLRREGIMQPAARIKELRERYGYNINRVALRTIYDDWGYPHRSVAFYIMLPPRG